MLKALGFRQDLAGVWTKPFADGRFSLAADCVNGILIYPDELQVNERQACNFLANENFVVFECVHRLLAQGYKPQHIELEHPIKVGHGASGGRLDVWVKDNDGNSLLIIECKTAGREFENAWKDTLDDGSQLFSYANALDSKTPFIALYASDWNGTSVSSDYRLVSLIDNEEYLKNLPKDAPSFKNAATVKERFRAWAETYQQDFTTRGLFEPEIAAYFIGKTKYTSADLKEVDGSEIQRKYHEFATILRQHNVSGHENAFDKLVNLFLAKIVDENENPDELKFYWKGAAYDDVFSLIDRLQLLYKRGMEEFLKETVTYIDNNDIEKAFHLFKKDATKRTILDYFRQLKFFTNNDFAFIDVHNEKLFHQNAAVLLKIIRMLQDIRLQTQEQNQFLGDLFEGFLDKGVKQSEGQFFTPTPIVRFLISSLPLETLIAESPKPPRVIDYACGAGHFLNEYCHQIFPCVRRKHAENRENGVELVPPKETFQQYYAAVTGIDKEYRLSKVSKVSASMYGQDEIRIVYADALAAHPDVLVGSYSVLVANPPYSVRGFLETLSDADRKRYELFDASGGLVKNNAIECFFVERAKQLLAPGGVAAIILPSSILNNTGIYTRMREILLKYFDIVAIAELGSGTFGKTGTNTATLFLRRKDTKPDLAEHYANRVETWFSGNFSLDAEFEDVHLLTAYCDKTGLPLCDYKTLLTGKPNAALLDIAMFKEYRKAFAASAEAKRIRGKRFTLKYSEDARAAELEKAWLAFLREIERDKLYTFMLAASNPLPVVLVRSPADKTAIKNFLGYEWSSRKGNEGIKYIGSAASAADDDEETLSRNKGVSHIKTPLFNPADLSAPQKINTLIRAAFNRETLSVPDDLSTFVSHACLTDMLDFSRVTFDKAFKTARDTRIEITSKYPLVKLGEVAEYSPDTVSAATLTPKTYVGVDNLLQNLGGKTDSGFVPASGSVTRYNLGDILLSNIRPYLKKIWFADQTGGASNDVLVLRIITDEFDPSFVYCCLAQDAFFDYVMGAVKGVKMPRGDKQHIISYPIPKPNIGIQCKIVSDCESVNAECEIASKCMEANKARITRMANEQFDIYATRPLGRISETPMYGAAESAVDGDPLSDHRYIRITDINDDGTLNDDWKTAANVEPKYILCDSDLLFARSGATAGKVFLYTSKYGKALYAGYLIRFRMNKDLILPGYVSMTLKSDRYAKWVEEHRRGLAQPNINAQQFASFQIPVPPLAEQSRIVSEVEGYEAEIAVARTVLSAAADRKRAIMKKWL